MVVVKAPHPAWPVSAKYDRMKKQLKKFFAGRTRFAAGSAINGLTEKWRIVMKPSQSVWLTFDKYGRMKMQLKNVVRLRTSFAAKPAMNEHVRNAARGVDFVMNSLHRSLFKPAKIGLKSLCQNETNTTSVNETMKPQSHFDGDCKQQPRNRLGTFARIWAAIAGTKGRFEQERFCPRFGTLQRKSYGNVTMSKCAFCSVLWTFRD